MRIDLEPAYDRLVADLAAASAALPPGVAPTDTLDQSDPRARLPLANVKSLASLVDASIAGRRFTMVLFLAFAVVAATLLLLAALGALAAHLVAFGFG